MSDAVGEQLDTLVNQALPVQPFRHAELVEQVDRGLLQDTGPDPPLDVVPVPRLHHHGVDPVTVQQRPEHQPGRTGADDADLGAHGRLLPARGRVDAGEAAVYVSQEAR